MLIFLQSANFSLSPTRLLDQSCAGVESSEPCRTSSTHRRIVALPHPRWKGTTKRYAPLISRWCQPPLVIPPGLHSGSQRRGDRPDRAKHADLVVEMRAPVRQ